MAGHLQKPYEALLAEVFSSRLIHADETYWPPLDKDPGTRWYAWTVASPDTVFHRIRPSRPRPARCGQGPGHRLGH